MKTNCFVRLFLFLIFYLLSYSSFAQVNLSQGLIAYYPFNGNANDVSGNNINGIVTNAILTTDRNGNSNSAYYFDGATSYIQLPYSSLFDFNPQDSFSISVWTLPDQGYSWPAQAVVVKSPPNPDFLLSNWNYGVYVLNYKAMSGYANNNFLIGSTTFTNSPCWYHIIVTYKNGIWNLYVNGSLEASDLSQTQFILRDGTSKIVFGKKGESFGDWYKGKMDEVRLYNRVLSQDEIKTLSANTSGLIDFGFSQSICSPRQVQFGTTIPNVQSFEWDFGNGQTNNNTLSPTVSYDDYGTYNIKLRVKYNSNCTDSLAKSIILENLYDDAIIVNKDTTICLGDSILLKTASSISNYCWKASTGVGPTSLNALLKPITPTTYVLTSQIVGSNLISNPDFSLGNVGFTSAYNYANSNVTEGEYSVGTSSIAWNQYMADCHDHTTGSGNMLMINGSPAAGVKVWSQSISVTPGTNYNFSLWISSLHIDNPAKLHFAINNVELGNDILAGSSTCQWKQFFSTWNSSNNTTATISIVNNNTIVQGNDFALDDIFFGQVTTKTDSVNVNVVGLCDSVKITGADKVCSASDTLSYSIYKSPNCTQKYAMQVDNAYADIISQTDTSLKLLFKKNGTTTIKVAYGNNCKIVADSLDVTIKFSPTSINFGPDVITCRDTSFILNAGDGFVTYAWQNGSSDSTFTVSVPGNYEVAVHNLCGLQLKDSFRWVKTFVTPFSVAPLTATVCTGDSVLFRASGGSSYSWSPVSNFSNPFSSSTKALVNSSQNFSVLISDPTCKGDTTFIIPVIASTGANITVTKSNDVNCSNDSAVLIASGGVSYTWSPNLYIARNNGNRITVKPYENITYIVRGKNEIGCYGQDSVTVYFFKTGDQKLFMPTAFTPNGDGKNDVFRPTFIGPSAKYDFQIYNRWGQLIFESKVPDAGWDGRVNGIPQKPDVYVFYITAEGGCNGKFVQKGTFALIR